MCCEHFLGVLQEILTIHNAIHYISTKIIMALSVTEWHIIKLSLGGRATGIQHVRVHHVQSKALHNSLSNIVLYFICFLIYLCVMKIFTI
jgi:hypothetical protein